MKEEIEKQLNEYFSIIDLNIIKLNAQLVLHLVLITLFLIV